MKTSNTKYYTGVGSRAVPTVEGTLLKVMAAGLLDRGYRVRTGDAQGCDAIFRSVDEFACVYNPQDIIDEQTCYGVEDHWAYTEAEKHLPNDRKGFDTWKPFVRALLARNMFQVLGPNGDDPSEFLLCWTGSSYYLDSSSGGTGYAIRCALAHKVPVFNLYVEQDRVDLGFFLQEKD